MAKTHILSLKKKCNISVYCYKWGEVARLEILKNDANCYDIRWSTDHLNIIEDCMDIQGILPHILS